MLRIIIEDSEGKSKSAQVDPSSGDITIGRKEGNFIRLKERNVSRNHARIFSTEEGLFIEPVSARYGLKLNSHKIEGVTPLALGDEIRVGDYRLYLQDENQPDPNQQKDPNAVVDIPPEMQPRFVVISSNFAGREYHITKSKVTIGRNPTSDIQIEHQSVSGTHAEVRRNPRGDFEIRDLGSSNGTKINGMPINDVYRLSSGDAVVLGHVAMRFCAPGDFWSLNFGINDEPKKNNTIPILIAVVLIVLIIAGTLIYIQSLNQSTVPAQPATPQISEADKAKQEFKEKFEFCNTLKEEKQLEDALECYNKLSPATDTDRKLVAVKVEAVANAIKYEETISNIEDALQSKDCNTAASELKNLRKDIPEYEDLDKQIKICKIDYYFDKADSAIRDKDFDTAEQNRDNILNVKSGGNLTVDEYAQRKRDQLSDMIAEAKKEATPQKPDKPSGTRPPKPPKPADDKPKAASYKALMEKAGKADDPCKRLDFCKQAQKATTDPKEMDMAKRCINAAKLKCK